MYYRRLVFVLVVIWLLFVCGVFAYAGSVWLSSGSGLAGDYGGVSCIDGC